MTKAQIATAVLLASLLLAGSLLAAPGLAATPEEAAKHFDAGRWAEAAEAYAAILEREPANPMAWLRLASARAAGGDADRALEALKGWAGSGTFVYQAVMAAPEMARLREEPRFEALVGPMRPCALPENRHFDFWLGEWDVVSPQYPGVTSRSRITRINDGCTIREDYATPVGYAGTSLNFYDARRKRWHQTWIDNQGGALYLEGGFVGGAMVLSMEAGPQAAQRIRWTMLPDGRVRQHWEATSDGGQNWSTVYDGYYTRSTAP